MSLTIPLAHGIGGIRDPVLPDWLMYYAAALTLILSFVALGVLWRKPILEGRDRGRPLSERWQRLILWTGWRIILGALSVGLLVLVWLAALVGKPDAGMAERLGDIPEVAGEREPVPDRDRAAHCGAQRRHRAA